MHLEGFKCRIGACLFAAGHFDALVLSNVLSNPVQAKVSTSDFHDRCEAAKSLQEGIRNIALAIKRRPQFRRSQSFRKRSPEMGPEKWRICSILRVCSTKQEPGVPNANCCHFNPELGVLTSGQRSSSYKPKIPRMSGIWELKLLEADDVHKHHQGNQHS